jgi:hypothetical protein
MSNRTTLRRFLRFRLRTLLLLPPLFAVAWWWVTWPERTVRRFVELLNSGNVEAARAMTDFPQEGVWKTAAFGGVRFTTRKLAADGWRDYLTARGTAAISVSVATGEAVLDEFVVRRSRLSLNPAVTRHQFVEYEIQHANMGSLTEFLPRLLEGVFYVPMIAMTTGRRVAFYAPPQTLENIGKFIAMLDVPPPPPYQRPSSIMFPIRGSTDGSIRGQRRPR